MTSVEPSLVTGTLPNGATVRVVPGPSLRDDTLRQMASLLQSAFGQWPAFPLPVTPEEHLRWKVTGPPGSEVLVSLVEMDGRLASMAIELGLPTRVLTERALLGLGGDTATHPHFEGRGLYGQRVAFKREHIDPRYDGYFSVSLNPRVLNRRRGEDRPELENAPRILARVFDAGRVARELRSSGSRLQVAAVSAGLAPLAVGPALIPRLHRRGGLPSVVPVTRFDEGFDELFEESAADFEVIRERSSDYLNWRLADPRAGGFEVLAATEGGRLLGYVALRVGRARSYVADVLVRPGRGDALEALLLAAERVFRDAGTAVALAWLPNVHPYRRAFRRLGYLDTHRRTGAVLRRSTRAGATLIDTSLIRGPRSRLHVTLSDVDLI